MLTSKEFKLPGRIYEHYTTKRQVANVGEWYEQFDSAAEAEQGIRDRWKALLNPELLTANNPSLLSSDYIDGCIFKLFLSNSVRYSINTWDTFGNGALIIKPTGKCVIFIDRHYGTHAKKHWSHSDQCLFVENINNPEFYGEDPYGIITPTRQ
jgi:hypothetical protein